MSYKKGGLTQQQYVAQGLHGFIMSEHWISAFITLLLCLQSRTDSYAGHYPAGTSVQNVIHWQQVQVCWHINTLSMAFYATDSQQGNPEVTGLEICPSHLTCHRGSPAPQGSPDHSLNFPFVTRLWDFPRAHHTSLGSNGFQPSSLFMEMCAKSRSEHKHSLVTWQVA